MHRERGLRVVFLSLTVAVGVGVGPSSTAQDEPRGVPAGGQHACTSMAAVQENLGCRDLIIEIASAYVDSIETPGIAYLPELPALLAPDAKRWINRSRTYQAPNNDGRAAVLAGVAQEPECVFPNKRWTVEGSIESATAAADFDAFCPGFPHAVIRELFLIEQGQIKEIEVRFVQVRCPTTAPWPCLP